MSGTFSVNVQESRGFVAVPADLDALAVVLGCSSAGSDFSPFFLSGASAIANRGYGDAVDTLCQIIEQPQQSGASRKFPAAMYSTTAGTDGSYGTPDTSGVTGVATVGVDSSVKPYGTYEAQLLVSNGFTVGTSGGTLKWSLDGGRNYSRVTALGTATFFTIPNSNVKFTFSPSGIDLTALNTLLAEMHDDYEAHRVLTTGGVHGTADTTNALTATSPPTSTATRIALANDLRAMYSAHRVLTAGGVHGAPDTTNVITHAACTDDSTCLQLALELKTKYNAHIILTAGAVHGLADSTNTTTSPNPAAGVLNTGDVVKCRTFAPIPDGTALDIAFADLAAAPGEFALVVCEFPMTTTLLAHISSGLDALKAVGKRCAAICRTRIPTFESSESDATWNSSISADFLAYDDSRIILRAGYGLITDAMTTRQYKRSTLAQFAADVVRVERAVWPSAPADQSESKVTLIDATGATVGHDEGPRGASTGLSDDSLGNRFACEMRLPVPALREAVYNTVPWTLYASDERIRNLMVRRVANAMEREAVAAGVQGLGAQIFYTPADPNVPGSQPTLTDASRNALHGKIYNLLAVDFAADIQNAASADVDAGLVQVNPVITVTGGNLITIAVTLAPLVLGYLLSLNITLAVRE